ncbi:MAG: ParB/RepB/Spo0J family partition protein [Bacteriovoracaceae bacterium]
MNKKIMEGFTFNKPSQSRHLESDKVVNVPLQQINFHKDQARSTVTEPEFIKLKESIQRDGLFEPIILHPVSQSQNNVVFEVVSGERRLTACRELGYSEIKAKIIKDKVKAKIASVATNSFRQDIHPIDKGTEFKVLLEHKICKNNVEIAKMFGITKQSVGEYLKYSKIPREVRKIIVENDLRGKQFLRKMATMIQNHDAKFINDQDSLEKIKLIKEQSLLFIDEELKRLNEKISTKQKSNSKSIVLKLNKDLLSGNINIDKKSLKKLSDEELNKFAEYLAEEMENRA